MNGIAFSDADEVWWMETIGGHHWIAKRVPDDRVVIMPNQFGLDSFDFEDAYGKKKDHLCSEDLREFVEKIYVHQAENIDGRKVQRVRIVWNCIGEFTLPTPDKRGKTA